MFYVYATDLEGMIPHQQIARRWIFLARCQNPVVAHGFRESGYTVTRCIDITKFIGQRLELVK